MKINHDNITALLRGPKGAEALPLYLVMIEYPFTTMKLTGAWEACRRSEMSNDDKLKVRQESSRRQINAADAAVSSLVALQGMCCKEDINPPCDEDPRSTPRSETLSAIYIYVRNEANRNANACNIH